MSALDALQLKLINAGVMLTDDDYNTLINGRPISFSMKYGRFSSVVPPMRRNRLTVSFIKEEAKQKWTELSDVQISLYSDKEGKHKINDNFLQDCAVPLTIFVKTTQKGFSEFTDIEALEYAGVKEISMVGEDFQDNFFPPPLSIDEKSENALRLEHTIQDLKNRHKLYDPLEEGCEYTRREFISPILVLAASISGVKLACEEQVEGSVGKGPVDWVAHYENHRICITEGKKDNITQGLYQNLAQLTAAGEGRGKKRAFCVDLPLYGIATTYTEWIFLRLDPPPSGDGQDRSAVRLETMIVARPNAPFFKQSVVIIAGRLAGLFSSQKQLLDNASGEAAKRTKKSNYAEYPRETGQRW